MNVKYLDRTRNLDYIFFTKFLLNVHVIYNKHSRSKVILDDFLLEVIKVLLTTANQRKKIKTQRWKCRIFCSIPSTKRTFQYFNYFLVITQISFSPPYIFFYRTGFGLIPSRTRIRNSIKYLSYVLTTWNCWRNSFAIINQNFFTLHPTVIWYCVSIYTSVYIPVPQSLRLQLHKWHYKIIRIHRVNRI